MIEDAPGDPEEGQLEFNFFNQDDSDPAELDVQAMSMYEDKDDTASDRYRYCDMMTVQGQPFIEPSCMKT